MRVYVGTSGWSYPRGKGAWNGVFYPHEVEDRAQLEFYSRFFDAVELNSSFYRTPNPYTVRAWAQKTPPGFRFTAKLFMKFTHPEMYRRQTGNDPSLLRADFDAFLSAMDPLVQKDKLGAVLAQFPPSFKASDESLAHLATVLHGLRGLPVAVELRHRSWTEFVEARQLIEECGAAWAMIDEPKFRTSIGEVPLTSKLGYFRFHGRNYEEWWKGDAEGRYNYLYSPQEQQQFAREVRQVADQAEEVYVFYNNHFRAKAVVNALEMRYALGQAISVPLPAPLVAEYPRLSDLAAG